MSKARIIPFFNYPALFYQQEEKFISIFKDVCSRGAYILQKDLVEFEENLKKFLDVKYVFGVSMENCVVFDILMRPTATMLITVHNVAKFFHG